MNTKLKKSQNKLPEISKRQAFGEHGTKDTIHTQVLINENLNIALIKE